MTTDEARMRTVLTDRALTVSTFVMRASFVIPTLVAVICGIVAASEAGEFPAFEYHRIDNIGSLLGQTALADIDRDGDLDWVVGESASRGGTIWWWEYQAADRWIRHPLGTGRTDVGGSLYDVDGDGWLDMFSGTRILINSASRVPKPSGNSTSVLLRHTIPYWPRSMATVAWTPWLTATPPGCSGTKSRPTPPRPGFHTPSPRRSRTRSMAASRRRPWAILMATETTMS